MNEPAIEIAVVRIADGWRILTPSHRSRLFDYQIDAEEAALKLCRRAKEEGEPVKLLVQDRVGQLREVPVN